jgi:hypothetical protein
LHLLNVGIGLAERYLREAKELTQQQVIDALIAFHGCTTPQEMIDSPFAYFGN